MQETQYLALGKILGSHYEIVEVLGSDAIEILYLVKDTHRLENLFVIKELFVASYAHRDNTDRVYSSENLLEEFKENQKKLIKETTKFQQKNSTDLQTHGYFEENNTIYTIMEFKKDIDINNYFKILTPLNNQEAKKGEKDSSLFSKILLLMVAIFLGLAWYTYNMMQEEKEDIKKKYLIEEEIKTTVRHTIKHEKNTSEENSNEESNKTLTIPEGAEYISQEEQLIRAEQESNPLEEVYNDDELIPQDEIENYQEAVSIPMDSRAVEITMPSLGTPIPKHSEAIKQEHPMLGTPIGNAPMSPF